MRYKDREGNLYEKTTSQDRFIRRLYTSKAGRILVKILTRPFITKVASLYLSSRMSTIHIKSFIKKNNINMDEYMPAKYKSYNDFFTRRIKFEYRPINRDKTAVISPSDGKITVYHIEQNMPFEIKNSRYTVESILQNKELAHEFSGGYCVIIRLSVDNYHRYCYIDNATIVENKRIKGILHTVNPIATACADVYKENSREYTVFETENFGKVVQIEVGAMMVGKIVNNSVTGTVSRGEEKGLFEFGGSTIVLLFQKDRINISEDILNNSSDNCETLVKMGEKIGATK